jgi:hypothetical protein
MRADALLSDDFRASDMAWMDMKSNPVDIVIGPIETYEDQLFGYKASYEGMVLLKDKAWSEKLARFAGFLPELQRSLPVPEKYRAERPRFRGRPQCLRGDLLRRQRQRRRQDHRHQPAQRRSRAAGQGHAPAAAGERHPRQVRPHPAAIARELIAEDQIGARDFRGVLRRHHVSRSSTWSGIKNTLDGKGHRHPGPEGVRSNFEEGKADVLGVWLITALTDKGELPKEKLMDAYVTFLAGILRSVRFGAGESHAKAKHDPLPLLRAAGRVHARSRHRPLSRRVRQDARGGGRAVGEADHRCRATATTPRPGA